MSNGWILCLALTGWLVLMLLISFGLATARHPVAMWLWADILGVMK